MRTPSGASMPRHATLMPVLPAPDDATDYATRLLREAPSRYLLDESFYFAMMLCHAIFAISMPPLLPAIFAYFR
jgi:hypothetical protein